MSWPATQLDVSVRDMAGKLTDGVRPVTFLRTGDIHDLEDGLRHLEAHIGNVLERLQQRELELLRSEQLAQVGQLAAGMAHELRNPLTPTACWWKRPCAPRETISSAPPSCWASPG